MERRIRGIEQGESSEQVIRWERVLPRRFLRVLLVENDDSTRHIVTALLRKCSYQVAAVADGLKAWEFLKEKNYNFDLVLTEVVIPSLSGIDLLSKIISNEICKNIPVIMMSSHDSISIVFKCMLKGAADFLVKPVRKNELRNLWQHVWRKYCSSSCGNGSENQPRFEAVCDNGAANIHAHQNVDNKSKTRDSVDRESDNQSTCSKPDTESRHEQVQSEPLQTEYGNFSREIESKLEMYDTNPAMAATTSSMHAGEKEKDKLTGIEIKVTLSGQASLSAEKIRENSPNKSPSKGGDSFHLRCKQDATFDPESFFQKNVRNEPSREFIDFIGTIATGQCSYGVSEDNFCRKDILCEAAKTSDVNKGACSFSFSPLWELSLKRPEVNATDEKGFRERQILNHSDSSAFSRYGNTGRLSCPESGYSPPNMCIKTGEFVANYTPESGSDGTCRGKSVPFSIKRTLASATNNEEAGPFVVGPSKECAYVGHSSTQEEVAFSHPQLGVLPLPIPDGAIPFQGLCAGYGAVLRPVLYPEPSFSLCSSAAVQNAIEHHAFHQLRGVKDQIVDQEPSDPQLVLHATNQSGSYSQSNHNGSGINRSNEGTNAAVNVGVALDGGNEDGFQNSNGQVLDQDHARREVALTKFRLKRKDRCFEKMVRYHSRKKLAEQRPRVKGQIVRRTVYESTTTGTETDD